MGTSTSPRSASAMLWAACALAVLVLAGGLLLGRRVERFPSPPPGNRMDDTFREAISHLTLMEKQWEEALDRETKDVLEAKYAGWMERTVGVVRMWVLNPRQPTPAHASGEEMPVLERHAKKTPGEWIIPGDLVYGGGFSESPGHPPVYVQGNGKRVVVMVLDRAAAAAVAMKDLSEDAAFSFRDEPGRYEWRANAARADDVPGAARPDEILRHVSRFGNIELRRWYPIRTVVAYHTPTVAGAATLSTLLVVAGVMGAASQRNAHRLAEERVSFVNRVSHELRSPLTNLLLNADLALDELPAEEEKVRRRVGLIREETGRLSRIVDNVLAFARLERGAEKTVASSCEPAALVAEARESFAPLFARKGIRCEWRVAVEGAVRMDGDAFSQILGNLLSNVEKYAGAGARCTISTERAGGRLALVVEDDGPGIPREARERIFKPFVRARESTSEGVSGTGLGLAISRELAARMGGTLELLETERGAAFRLAIPLHGREAG